MSKFVPLWEYVAGQQGSELLLSFGQVEEICGLSMIRYNKLRKFRKEKRET